MAKHDLSIAPPLMNAAGALGFSPDLHASLDWSKLGAFVTHPVSLEPRTPAGGRRFIAFAGGFVLHTGYPNPGMSQVLRRYARQWRRAPVPVIVHLLGRNPGKVERMERQLESVEGVVGLEVGVSSEASANEVTALVQAAAGELAVIVRLPLERAAELAQAALGAGASAISLAPARGTYPAGQGELVQGRLYGPALLPMALRVVRELRRLGIPTIGAGGVYTRQHIDAMLSAGALAVQLDSSLWRGGGINLFA
jgi:dihydroorotate dehydrogenase (NAD+) catalytic subunit